MQGIIKLWNSVPQDITKAKTLARFIIIVDVYMARNSRGTLARTRHLAGLETLKIQGMLTSS